MRDNFDKKTVEALAHRVGFHCSNPDCRRLTSGPHTIETKFINGGVAAHITAASPNGPRYNPNISSVERSSIRNGLWVCQLCGKLIDSDELKYTLQLLRRWKEEAEQKAVEDILQAISAEGAIHILAVAEPISRETNLANIDFSNLAIVRYFTVGVTNPNLLPFFELFTVEDNQVGIDAAEFEDVIFDNVDESREIFASLHKIISIANNAEKSERQEVFERAWKEEAISRIGAFAFGGSNQYFSAIPEGIKYVIWGVRKDYAHLIRILRCEHIIRQPRIIDHDAVEVVYYDLKLAARASDVIQDAIRQSQGDAKLFGRILFEAVMRVRAGI